MKITWRRLGGELPPGAQQIDGILRIPNFSADFSGRYECRVEIEREFAFGFVQVKVDESDVLYVEITSSKDIVPIGSNVEFRCRVKGDSSAQITWEKKDGAIPPSAIVSFVIFLNFRKFRYFLELS